MVLVALAKSATDPCKVTEEARKALEHLGAQAPARPVAKLVIRPWTAR